MRREERRDVDKPPSLRCSLVAGAFFIKTWIPFGVGFQIVLTLGKDFEFLKAGEFKLANALSCEVHDGTHFFKRNAAAVCNVKRAGLLKLPDLFIGKIEFYRTSFFVNIEIKMMAA